jgi:hypothetical protein
MCTQDLSESVQQHKMLEVAAYLEARTSRAGLVVGTAKFDIQPDAV